MAKCDPVISQSIYCRCNTLSIAHSRFEQLNSGSSHSQYFDIAHLIINKLSDSSTHFFSHKFTSNFDLMYTFNINTWNSPKLYRNSPTLIAHRLGQVIIFRYWVYITKSSFAQFTVSDILTLQRYLPHRLNDIYIWNIFITSQIWR